MVVRQLSQRGLRKSELSLPPHMTDQQVMVPVVSHEMAVAEPAQTKPQTCMMLNLTCFTECRGSPILTGIVSAHGIVTTV